MITTLEIRRFKSIRSLKLACRKVNVFIGAPDTGKTNILEALSFLSRLGWALPLDNSLRLRQELGCDALFYRQFFDQPFEIGMRFAPAVPWPDSRGLDAALVSASVVGPDRRLRIDCPWGSGEVQIGGVFRVQPLQWIRLYSYASSEHWQYTAGTGGDNLVATPHGRNLLYVARHDQRVYDFLKETISALNWRLRFDQGQKTFRLSEVRQDEILDYNLDLLSDSLKRLFFYGAILLTSEDATLVMDEPDVFAFPPYPKTLGEMIGADTSNQFFLTTHNPYFLSGLLGKTAATDLALFVCYRDEDGSTAVRLLDSQAISEVIEQGANVFFNLEKFVEA